MLKEGPAPRRESKTERLAADLVVAGGGLAGTCCAITAARAGARVVLIQDRPVLGGNASSEVRLWVLGATAHGYNNNRWAREGGVVDEVLTENLWRNPEGNPVIFDTILLELASREPALTLLLNTVVHDLEKDGPDAIKAVRAFCSQNGTAYAVTAPLFCDATGDGTVGFLAGAAFRMGAESASEFGERFAPPKEYGELLGHSLYFYSRDTGRPVRFVPPGFALADITQIPRWRQFNTRDIGCRLWWIEWGGRLDTVHDTERIKWELWRVVYGVWHHIKNSGKFPDAANLTLEWVGQIPGKRESRRFEGPSMLTQGDLIERRRHDDAVAFGGWSIDLHPAEGVYSDRPPCDQWHAKGLYGIPYRCLFSRNIRNLFLGGRLISASHVAFGSTRVMATCAHAGQAAGIAAARCARDGLLPADLLAPERLIAFRRELLRTGQHVPGFALEDPDDLARTARIEASSRFVLGELPADGRWLKLDREWAQLVPVAAGPVPRATYHVRALKAAALRLRVRRPSRPDEHCPDEVLHERTIALAAGKEADVSVEPAARIETPCYLFYGLAGGAEVEVRTTERRVTGLLAVRHHNDQTPESDIGVEAFEFWAPIRRPGGRNLAVRLDPPADVFGPANVVNGVDRPTSGPNAWVAAPDDPAPKLTLTWEQPQAIRRIELFFDPDYDHPLESVLMGHPERVVPFMVKRWRVTDGAGRILAERDDWHQARAEVVLDSPAVTDRLVVELLESWGPAPKALFAVRAYA